MSVSDFVGKRVLVVEDDREMLNLIETVVRGLGVMDVDRASNGERAWNHVREGRSYDLILCDWNMPVVNGLTFLKRFRKKHPFTKVLMVTSMNRAKDFETAMNVGIDGYILKPFTLAQLSGKIRGMLRD